MEPSLRIGFSLDDISPTLTVNKVCNPSGDTGLFNLQIDDVTRKSDATCGGLNGTTGPVPVNAGSHTVKQTAGSNRKGSVQTEPFLIGQKWECVGFEGVLIHTWLQPGIKDKRLACPSYLAEARCE